MPRLTVIMPTYNVAPYVREAVESVLAQSFRDFTLLVMDDCSTDATAAVVEQFQDPRLRLVRNERNLGLADNLNRALALADTELVARMDGDDIAQPDWLATGVHLLDRHPHVDIVSFGFQFFGDRQSVVRFPRRHADSKCQMLFGCTVIVPIMRRAALGDERYLSATFPAEDYHLWARLYPRCRVYNVQRTLFLYRAHASQISTSLRERQERQANAVRFMMLDHLSANFTPDERAFFTDRFVPATLYCRADIDQLCSFARRLRQANRPLRHYQPRALRRRLRRHIAYAVYGYVDQAYFRSGYRMTSYLALLRDRLWHLLPSKQRVKLFVKCLLRKPHAATTD